MKGKIKYIIGMIWWQFRKKKVKRRMFERIRENSSKARVSNSPYMGIEKLSLFEY